MPRPAIKALLIDLSGTLHVGSEPIEGAAQALQRLRNRNVAVRFCSNSSKESAGDLQLRLERMGFEVRPEELWTSLSALRDVVQAKQLRSPYFLLSESAMKEFPDHVRANHTARHQTFDSVVVGLAPDLMSYDYLTTAFRVLMSKPEADSPKPLITAHKARYIRTPDGELSLGPGPFVAALENAAAAHGVQAEAIGKPGRAFFERVIFSLPRESSPINSVDNGKCQYEEIAMIGDDIEADLGSGTIELKLWRVLVKTGKYQQGDESREGVEPPDEIHESFSSFVDIFLVD